MKNVFIYVLPLCITLFGIYMSFATDILRDTSQSTTRPYSFARTQLMWWSLIIISCFTSYYGSHDKTIELKPEILILLGISLSATVTAKLIDTTDINNNLTRFQDNDKGKGFLINILSDKDGLSVARFQSFLFNIIFGIIFITTFISYGKFYEFDNTALALLGISSAGYVGMKLNENK